jgi:hypothetical protein
VAVTRPSAVVPNVGPQRRHKGQLKRRCRAYCLAPAFTTKQTYIMHKRLGRGDVRCAEVCKRLFCVGSVNVRVCMCGVREKERCERVSERQRERVRKTEADKE